MYHLLTERLKTPLRWSNPQKSHIFKLKDFKFILSPVRIIRPQILADGVRARSADSAMFSKAQLVMLTSISHERVHDDGAERSARGGAGLHRRNKM